MQGRYWLAKGSGADVGFVVLQGYTWMSRALAVFGFDL